LLDTEYREGESIWALPEEPPMYLECLVRVSLNKQNDNNLPEIYQHAVKTGYKPGKLVARFMGTVYREYDDYFKGWLELL
jgi:hypothetical protein